MYPGTKLPLLHHPAGGGRAAAVVGMAPHRGEHETLRVGLKGAGGPGRPAVRPNPDRGGLPPGVHPFLECILRHIVAPPRARPGPLAPGIIGLVCAASALTLLNNPGGVPAHALLRTTLAWQNATRTKYS